MSCEDLSKYIHITDDLIEENRNLVRLVYQKTVDAQRLAESLLLNDNEEIIDLKHQIEMFREECAHLNQYLLEQRKREEDLQLKIKQLNQQLQNTHDLDERQRLNFQHSRDREEELVKSLRSCEGMYADALDKIENLQGKLLDSENLARHYHTQIGKKTDEVDSLNRDLDEKLTEKSEKIIKFSQQLYLREMELDALRKTLEG